MGLTNFVNNKCHRVVIEICGRCGENAYQKPYIFNVLGVAITLLCGMGFVALDFKSDTFTLWIPEGSEVIEQYYDYEDKFGEYPEYFGITFKERNGENLLTTERLPLTQDIFDLITYNITANYDGPFQFEDMCDQLPDTSVVPPLVGCASVITSMWYPYLKYTEASGIPYYLDQAIITGVNTNENTQLAIEVLMADEDKFEETIPLTPNETLTFYNGGSVLRTRWQFAYGRIYGNMTYDQSIEFQKKRNQKFLAKVTEFLKDDDGLKLLRNVANGTDIEMVYASSNSLLEESTRAITNAIPLLIGAFLWMFILFSLMLGDMGCVKGRPWLALIGIFVVVMSIIIGFGLGFAFGLKLNAFCIFLIFIIIASSFANENTIIETINNTPLPPINKSGESTDMKLGARRFFLAMRDAGLGITISTILKVAAFGAAAIVPVKGSSSFCLFTMLCLIAEYILQFLIFLPVVGLDEHRKMTSGALGDKDVKHTTNTSPSGGSGGSSNKTAPSSLTSPSGRGEDDNNNESERGGVQFVIKNCLLQVLDKRLNRVCIILFFVGIWSASAVAFASYTRGELDLGMTLPDDSYVTEYLKITDEEWGTLTFPEYEIVIENQDFSNNETRQTFKNMMNELEDLEVRGSSMINPRFVWYYSFDEYLLGVSAQVNAAYGTNYFYSQDTLELYYDDITGITQAAVGTNYYDALNRFAIYSQLYDEWIEYDKYNTTILLADTTEIVYTKFTVYWAKPDNIWDQYIVKEKIDSIIAKHFGGDNGYVMDRYMPYYYIPHWIHDAMLMSLALVLITIFVLLPLLMDLRLALFIGITIFLTYLTLFGWMGMCQLQLDLVTYVMLIAAISIIVDYLVFVTHAVIGEVKRKHFGAIIMRTAFATLLGSILIVFIEVGLFRRMIGMFTGTVIVTALHALLFIPAVMGECICLYQATAIEEMDAWHTPNPRDQVAVGIELGKNEKQPKHPVRQDSAHSFSQNSRSSGPVKTGRDVDDDQSKERTPVAARQESQSGQSEHNFNLGDLAAVEQEKQKVQEKGPREIVQPPPFREESHSHRSTSSRGRGHTEIKRNMDEINSITADIMVLAVEFELDKKKKKQLKRITKQIFDFSDAKVNDLHSILKQVEAGKARGLETTKIKALFIEELDDFIEENIDALAPHDEESSQSGL